MSEEDPLEELYVDKADINKERLSDSLSDIIGIDRETGDAVILSEFSNLTQSQKIFAYLLYRRATHELGHLDEGEYGMTASDLSDACGVPEGTLKPVAADSQYIESDMSKGGYIIREYAISEAISEVDQD